jgi:hypothetical protein
MPEIVSKALDFDKNNAKDKRFCNEEIYEEVSEELQLPIDLVKEVGQAHSEFSKMIIETGAFENITLPYLGKLKAKLRSVQKMTAKISRK